MAFHFGVPGFTGGYLGVDVFFVLSGFLITSLLLAEWQRNSSLDLRAFWSRRARRLLPGLAVVLVAIAVWVALTRAPDAASTRGDAIATLAYVANWRYVFAHRGYFAQYGPPSPLAHTWSLAIEEQFYVVWPLAALPVLRRWGARGVRNLALVGAAASAGWCILLFALGASTERLYYGTDTRAQAIMIGAALAAALALRPERRWGVLPLAGVVVLVVAGHALSGTSSVLYCGGFTVVALAAAAVVGGVVTHPERLVARALSWRPLRATGLVSYELYLWHWPVLVALTGARTGLSGVVLFTARVTVTVVLAVGTWALIDRPILTGRWALPRRPVARLSAVAVPAAAVVLAVATIGLTPTSAQATGALGVGGGGVGLGGAAGGAGLRAADGAGGAGLRAAGGAVPAHPTVHAVLLGDSVALTLGDGLLDREGAYGIDLIDGGLIGCGVLGAGQIRVQGVVTTMPAGCARWEVGWRALVSQQRPAVAAILVGRWEVVDRRFDGRWTHIGEPAFDAFVSAQLRRAIADASSTGARVMVITSPHFVGVERPDGGRWPEDDPARVDEFNRLLRAVVAEAGPRVSVFDLDAYAEPSGHFVTRVDGVTMRMADGVHFTQAGADLLAPVVLQQILRLAGVGS
jgi:peptidoglycan/LPS O-acetylase OafA/YrhL